MQVVVRPGWGEELEQFDVGPVLSATFFVSNFAGPNRATGVVAEISLPACIARDDISVAGCEVIGDGALRCSLGSLAVGQVRSFEADVPTGACAQIETLELAVAATSTSSDPEAANDRDTASIAVGSLAPQDSELVLRVTSSTTSVQLGDTFTLSAELENFGPQVADDLTLEFDVPLAARFVGADAPDPTGVLERVPLDCRVERGAASCSLPSLDVDERTDVLATLTAVAPGETQTTVRVEAARVATEQGGDRESVAEHFLLGDAIAADLDGDGCVTTRDLARLALALHRGGFDREADVNGDGALSNTDVEQLKAQFSTGQGCD